MGKGVMKCKEEDGEKTGMETTRGRGGERERKR